MCGPTQFPGILLLPKDFGLGPLHRSQDSRRECIGFALLLQETGKFEVSGCGRGPYVVHSGCGQVFVVRE